MENKNRFSTLRVFKLPSSKPPPPPPKDAPGPYNITPYITPGASTSQLTLNSAHASTPDLALSNSFSAQQTLRSPEMSEDTRFLSPHSPVTPRSVSPSRSPPTTSAFKKGLTKFSPFGKKTSRSQTLGPGTTIPHSPSLSALPEQNDEEGISAPWNFQHHIHVNGDLQGLPPSWSATLAEAGFTEQQIAELRSRTRDKAASGGYTTDTEFDTSRYSSFRTKYSESSSSQYLRQPTASLSGSSTSPSPPPLVNPKPRSDSLRRQFNTYSQSQPRNQNSASAALAMISTAARPPSPASSNTSSQPGQGSPLYPPHPYTQSQSQFQYQQTSSPSSHPQSPTDSLVPSFDAHSNGPSYENTATSSGPSYEHSNSQASTSGLTTVLTYSSRSHSHSPVPLSISSFRVVNEDPDSTPTPSTPPPAYMSPQYPGPSPNSKGRRRGSMEKTGFEDEADREQGPSGTGDDERELRPPVEALRESPIEEDTVVEAEEDIVDDGLEDDDDDADETGDHPSDLPSPLPRAAALPPRLSLHTDGDDDWSNMFSFLPSTAAEGTPAGKRASRRMSKRMSMGLGGSGAGGFGGMFDNYKFGEDGGKDMDKDKVVCSEGDTRAGVNGTNGRPSINGTSQHSSSSSISSPAAKRRSKRFSTNLAIIPPASANYVHATVTTPPQQPTVVLKSDPSPRPTKPLPLPPPSTEHLEPESDPSSSSYPSPPDTDTSPETTVPTSTFPEEVPPPSAQLQMSHSSPDIPEAAQQNQDADDTIITLHKSPAPLDVFTPDPDYPITGSPLWEEVRTLVRETGRGSQEREQAAAGVQRRSVSEPKLVSQQLGVGDEAEHPAPPRSAGLYAPSPRLNSRFSDATSFQGERDSRFSDGEALGLGLGMGMGGAGRLLESQNFVSRFSDATSFQGHSRFSDVSSVGVGAEPVSRFSAWSTSSGQGPGHGGHHVFSPMEPMPESPLPLSPPPRAITPRSRPSSLLPSRRSTDLPPPRPPPVDGLPPTPPEAAARRLSGSIRMDSYLSPQDERRLSSQSNLSIAQVQSAEIVTIAQASVVVPPARSDSSSRSRSQSPSGQLPLTKGGRLYVPSISSMNSLTSPVQGPPPMPLPPLGKVLPSMIMQQRRQQQGHGEQSSVDSTRSADGKGVDSSPISTSSTSSYSAEFSASFGFGYGSAFGELNPRNALSPAASTFDEALKGPILPYMRGSVPSSPMDGMYPALEDEREQGSRRYSLAHEKSGSGAQKASGWLSDDDDDEEMDDPTVQQTDPHPDDHEQEIILEPSLLDSPAMYNGVDPPLTPAITVNGFDVPDADEDHLDADSIVEQDELPLDLQPVEEYIYLEYDPVDMFTNFTEVAQGHYGSVYKAHVIADDGTTSDTVVAIKKVPISVNGTLDIAKLCHELTLMSQVRYQHVLASDGLFYDFVDNMLWIRMQLMTRSLGDVLVLFEQGVELDEPIIARFALDALLALSYLNEIGIAHRDVRSDNLLIDSEGILKLADFSNAVLVSEKGPLRYDNVGVHHWQAPEVRTGRYDASKVDIWSIGATVWECAEYVPPFADIEDMSALTDRYPPLSRKEEYSHDFHEFLRLCSEPAAERPSANQLLHNPFIEQSCPRSHIVEVLSLCQTLEEGMQEP